jgi:hypothetical protein
VDAADAVSGDMDSGVDGIYDFKVGTDGEGEASILA